MADRGEQFKRAATPYKLPMLSVEELQKLRSPNDLWLYVRSVFKETRANRDLVKVARLRNGLFRRFAQELYPLSIFCKWKYSDINVLCQLVLGNQGYDAKIYHPSTDRTEHIEITWPTDGKKEHQDALLLNERGIGSVEVGDFAEERQKTIEQILRLANKKSLKDYSHPEGSSLLILIDIYPYFYLENREHRKQLSSLINELKKIDFRVDSVYVILMPVEKVICVKAASNSFNPTV